MKFNKSAAPLDIYSILHKNDAIHKRIENA